MQTLLQYLLIDVVPSLVVFGFLYYFRKGLLADLKLALRSFLGTATLEYRVDDLEREVHGELKPKMKEAMDDVFGYGEDNE
jgi:hypothetical protein